MPPTKSRPSPGARGGRPAAAPPTKRTPVLALAIGFIVVLGGVAIIASPGPPKKGTPRDSTGHGDGHAAAAPPRPRRRPCGRHAGAGGAGLDVRGPAGGDRPR